MVEMYRFTQEECREMLLNLLVRIVHRAGNDVLQPHGNLIDALRYIRKPIIYDAHITICTQPPRVINYRARSNAMKNSDIVMTSSTV